MARSLGALLRDQGRGVVGALIVSAELLLTMEMWWHAWQLPLLWLIAYAVVGLVAVLAITRSVGFREEDEGQTFSLSRALVDFTELLLQSFLTAYAALLLFGVVGLDDSLLAVVRLGLLFVVPLGFGAAVANAFLSATGDDEGKVYRLHGNLGMFAVGAVFVSMTIAPTGEVLLLAAYAGWTRLLLVVVTSLLVAYLVLFELEFRGHQARTSTMGARRRATLTVVIYAIGCVVAGALLAAFGRFEQSGIDVWTQLTIVLAFPATLGASAARVVLG